MGPRELLVKNSSVRAHGASLRCALQAAVFALFVTVVIVPSAFAQLPYWNGGSPLNDNGTAAIKPSAWPSEPQWIAYTAKSDAVSDMRSSDPSTGGTTPQSYVSVSSGCPDGTQPSIYYFYDPATQMLFFRWRVQTAPNTYATGPSAGTASSTDPWSSALWTVFFDLNGDGYRDFAAHLNGSSGSPSAPIDVLTSIWSNSSSNSIDYVNDPAIHRLFDNPTAFVQGTPFVSNNQILQFSGTGQPSVVQWPNGTSETVWLMATIRISVNGIPRSIPATMTSANKPTSTTGDR
jgi:hypothetical protein